VHLDDPLNEYEPGAQSKHEDGTMAPVKLRAFPAEHGVHKLCPVESANDPGEQRVHNPDLEKE
jgi:hypothetical protein